MKIVIETSTCSVKIEEDGRTRELPLYSPEAFSAISRLWVKVGWELKYSYSFSWMGRPIIQFPEDLIRLQEVVYRVRPDVLVETGIAHGGSLVFHAGLLKAMGRGRVVGVDVRVRPEVRRALENHELSPLITIIEGSSVEPGAVDKVRACIRPGEKALVVLDSNHTRAHVAAELAAYGPLVAPDSYIVATDGIMQDLYDVPHGRPEWREDNPTLAAVDFAAQHPEFVLEEPAIPFNEGQVRERITYWPGAFLRRRSP